MGCASCGSENLERAKFCNACGATLGTVCPTCGHLSPLDSQICHECGQNLTSPADTISAHEGTRQDESPVPEISVEEAYESRWPTYVMSAICLLILVSVPRDTWSEELVHWGAAFWL